MKQKPSIPLIAIIAFITLVIASISYWNWSKSDHSPQEQMATSTLDENGTTTTDEETTTAKTRPTLSGPEEWEEYWNDDLGIGFRYPEEWTLREGKNSRGERIYISLKNGCNEDRPEVNCDYDINLGPAGSGLRDAEYTHPEYIVGGFKAKTWQTDRPGRDGYDQVIVADNIQFHIYTADKTKDKSDQLLSTVVFY